MSQTGERCCCAREARVPERAKIGKPSARAPRVFRGAFGLINTLTPGAVLVLLPKCPLCIVGYAAAAGIGLSVSTAENLRSVVLWSCLGLLAFFATRQIYLLQRLLPGRST